MNAARALPSGTVTFLFTDIEGSTRLLDELGPEPYAEAVAAHRTVIREAAATHGGVEVDTQGDAFFIAFPSAEGALATAVATQEALATGPIRVRIGIHTGSPLLTREGYVGSAVHLGARIAAAGHGGQVLLSRATRELLEAALTDLGEHRLKDFAEPVAIFQLGAERFPPLRTISNTNLPRPASSFVGRETEVAAIASLVRGGTRLVTLTGPGGSGKTRLAIEAAATLVPEFKAGVFWAGLAALRDPALVIGSIAQALGAQDGLAQHIGQREMLLVVDNLEQVVAAAPELATLVEACPNLHLMITSRERLRVKGELEYPVLPLAEREAAELFGARSGLTPDPTVHELCQQLDNLPLAVELAAARASVLTPVQILERLSERLDLLRGNRDAEARQLTLRATIEWSFELLTSQEQRLFARLAVFAGGCVLETAESVVDADLDPLQSLVDKSLVRHSGDRFWMLETIREFAGERLGASGEADKIRQKHAAHFLALAEKAEPRLFGGGSEPWADRIDLELDNIRAALDFLEFTGAYQDALRMAGSLGDFWDQRSHVPEGLARLRRLLGADPEPTPARAKAMIGLAQLSTLTGDLATALDTYGQALAFYRPLGDPRWEARALWGIGYVYVEQGDPARATPFLDEAVRIFREIGDTASLMWATRTLAFAHLRLNDLGRAEPLYQEAHDLARSAGDFVLEAAALGGLVGVALAQGRATEAAAFALEMVRIAIDIRDVLMQTSRLAVAAEALAELGQPAVAAQLLAYAEVQHEEIGAREPYVERDMATTLASIREQLDEPAVTEAWERGRRLTTEAAFALASASLASELASRGGSASPPSTRQ